MSRIVTFEDGHRHYVLESEGKQPCEMCGGVFELRPYGPNGENVCFFCAMEDPVAALMQLDARLEQVDCVEDGRVITPMPERKANEC